MCLGFEVSPSLSGQWELVKQQYILRFVYYKFKLHPCALCLCYFCNWHQQGPIPTQPSFGRAQLEELLQSCLSSFSLVIRLSPSGLCLWAPELVSFRSRSLDCSVGRIRTLPRPRCVTRNKGCPLVCSASFFSFVRWRWSDRCSWIALGTRP